MALILSKSTYSLPVLGGGSAFPWPLVFQQLRFRNRPNLQRPLPMHHDRKRMVIVTKPVLAPKPQICANVLETDKDSWKETLGDNPYVVFLAGKLRKDLAAHPMVVLFHCNHYTQREYQNIRGMLFDANFPMRIQEHVNSRVARYALEGTRWASALSLLSCNSAIGFCEETNLPQLLKMLKKMPQFVPIGVIYDNRLLHRDDVDRIAKIPSLLSLQTQLSTTLNLQGMMLSQSLMAGQAALSQSLTTLSSSAEAGTSSSSDSSDSSSDSDSDKE